MTKKQKPTNLINIHEAMNLFGYSESQIRRIVKENALTKVIKGKTRKAHYDKEDLKRIIAAKHYEFAPTIIKPDIKAVQRQLAQIEKRAAFEQAILTTVKQNILAIPVAQHRFRKPKFTGKSTEQWAGLNFGDLHIGEIVDPLEIAGMNAYNFEIFTKRLQYLVDKVLKICFEVHKGTQFPVLVINALGDMVSGYIHQELEVTGDHSMIEWVFGGAYILAQATIELAQMFPQIKVNCVVGNHGRLFTKKRYKRRYVNWDTVLYEAWAAYCAKQRNISFHIPKSFFLLTEINGIRCILFHGDDIRGWMGTPYYGIDRMVRNFHQLMTSIRHDFVYVFMGHFHDSATLADVLGKKLINGSFCGGDEYSIGKMGKCGIPEQTLFGMSDKGMTFKYEGIDLRPATKIVDCRYKYDRSLSVAEQGR